MSAVADIWSLLKELGGLAADTAKVGATEAAELAADVGGRTRHTIARYLEWTWRWGRWPVCLAVASLAAIAAGITFQWRIPWLYPLGIVIVGLVACYVLVLLYPVLAVFAAVRTLSQRFPPLQIGIVTWPAQIVATVAGVTVLAASLTYGLGLWDSPRLILIGITAATVLGLFGYLGMIRVSRRVTQIIVLIPVKIFVLALIAAHFPYFGATLDNARVRIDEWFEPYAGVAPLHFDTLEELDAHGFWHPITGKPLLWYDIDEHGQYILYPRERRSTIWPDRWVRPVRTEEERNAIRTQQRERDEQANKDKAEERQHTIGEIEAVIGVANAHLADGDLDSAQRDLQVARARLDDDRELLEHGDFMRLDNEINRVSAAIEQEAATQAVRSAVAAIERLLDAANDLLREGDLDGSAEELGVARSRLDHERDLLGRDATVPLDRRINEVSASIEQERRGQATRAIVAHVEQALDNATTQLAEGHLDRAVEELDIARSHLDSGRDLLGRDAAVQLDRRINEVSASIEQERRERAARATIERVEQALEDAKIRLAEGDLEEAERLTSSAHTDLQRERSLLDEADLARLTESAQGVALAITFARNERACSYLREVAARHNGRIAVLQLVSNATAERFSTQSARQGLEDVLVRSIGVSLIDHHRIERADVTTCDGLRLLEISATLVMVQIRQLPGQSRGGAGLTEAQVALRIVAIDLVSGERWSKEYKDKETHFTENVRELSRSDLIDGAVRVVLETIRDDAEFIGLFGD